MAVKVTGSPGQIVVEVAEIETPAGDTVLTVMVIEFEFAGLLVAQTLLEVIIQVTISPLFNVVVL